MIKDPPFKDKWVDIENQYKQNAGEAHQFREYKSFSLKALIAKANDDLRQEILAMQLMRRLKQIFEDVGIPLYLRPYDIIVTSNNSGFIEYIPDTISIDQLKKKLPNGWTLKTFY